MDNMNLPREFIEFLSAAKKLDYDPSRIEPGNVGLKALDQLEMGVVWINSDDSPLAADDPHAGENGYYEVPAISLLSQCEAYDPDFILLWLPCEQLFGTWDCDHWDLRIFPGTKWSDIVADPATYLNAQWSDYDGKISKYFKPYPKYPFKEGAPF